MLRDEFVPCSATNERIGRDARCRELLPEELKAKLEEDIALARGPARTSIARRYREGHLSPVYFGSALKNFGVRELMSALAEYAPPPRPQAAKAAG